MNKAYALSQHLKVLENALLDQVHAAKWENGRDGSWIPRPESQKKHDDLRASWQQWQKACDQLAGERIRIKESPAGARLTEALESADRAVKLELHHTGSEATRWRLLFEYEKAFRTLRDRLAAVSLEINDVDAFTEAHTTELKQFRELYGDCVNVLVVINYDASDECEVIKNALAQLSEVSTPKVRFHLASDKTWLDELYSNVRVWMIGCDGGLVFLTKTNATERGFEHNPSVVFEFGFMCGLGKKCLMIRHKSIPEFTDVRGVVNEPYERAAEIRAKVERFLREKLGVVVSDRKP